MTTIANYKKAIGIKAKRGRPPLGKKPEKKELEKIIAHRKLTFHAERPPPPQLVQKELLMAASPS